MGKKLATNFLAFGIKMTPSAVLVLNACLIDVFGPKLRISIFTSIGIKANHVYFCLKLQKLFLKQWDILTLFEGYISR